MASCIILLNTPQGMPSSKPAALAVTIDGDEYLVAMRDLSDGQVMMDGIGFSLSRGALDISGTTEGSHVVKVEAVFPERMRPYAMPMMTFGNSTGDMASVLESIRSEIIDYIESSDRENFSFSDIGYASADYMSPTPVVPVGPVEPVIVE